MTRTACSALRKFFKRRSFCFLRLPRAFQGSSQTFFGGSGASFQRSALSFLFFFSPPPYSWCAVSGPGPHCLSLSLHSEGPFKTRICLQSLGYLRLISFVYPKAQLFGTGRSLSLLFRHPRSVWSALAGYALSPPLSTFHPFKTCL